MIMPQAIEPQATRPVKLLIAITSGARTMENAAFLRWIVLLQRWGSQGIATVGASDGPVHIVRELLTRKFLEASEFTHLLMLDTDHLHPDDIVERLTRWLSHEARPLVVSGLNYQRKEPYRPCAFMFGPDLEILPIIRWPEGLVRVDAVGAASLIVAREVFERLEPPWWQFVYWGAQKRLVGEDIWFCTPGGVVYGDFQDISQPMNLSLTHSGNLRRVTERFQRDYSGNLIEIKPWYGVPIRLTPNHQVYSGNTWVESKDMQKGQTVFLPRPALKSGGVTIDMRPYAAGTKETIEGFQFHRTRKAAITVPYTVPLNEETAWLFGMYAAEGHSKDGYVAFTLNIQEEPYAQKVEAILGKWFGVRAITRAIKGQALNLYVTSKVLARFFLTNFGEKAYRKRLPSWLADNGRYADQVIKGLYEGDGCYLHGRVAAFTTVSEMLAHQYRHLLAGVGVFSAIKKRSMGALAKHAAYDVEIPARWRKSFGQVVGRDYPDVLKGGYRDKITETQQGWHIPIRDVSIVSYAGPVYNITVEQDNSYVLNGIAVHNCRRCREAGIPVYVDTTTSSPHLSERWIGDAEFRRWAETHKESLGPEQQIDTQSIDLSQGGTTT